ncbi:MAG TPA: diguanylate cyclase, partial [Rhodopila sp.]|nr:diguanylate cyclase [Rhodopila sp.]
MQQTTVVEVRREHLKLLGLTIRLFAVVGISSIILLAIDFRSALSGVAGAACATIPVLYVLIVLQEIRWRRGGEDRAFLRRSLAILATQGICWGIFINSALTVANGSQRSLLAALVIAMISTPLVASPLSAAIAFWLPSAVSGVIFICTPEMFDPYLLLCFLGYANFTFAAMVISNRFMLERSIGRISLERQNETIALFLQDYVDNGSDWLWEIDADLTLRHVSPRLAEVARQPANELEGMPFVDLLYMDDAEPADVPLARLLRDRAPFRNLTLTVMAGNEVRWWTITGRPVTGPGGCFQGYRGIGSDVTEARRAEERVRYLASHDSLTGLANRQLFRDCLALAQAGGDDGVLGGARREFPHSQCIVLLLDLDRFKSVNDSFGHAVGDELLVAVAERLRRCVRDGSVVARLGGDEF